MKKSDLLVYLGSVAVAMTAITIMTHINEEEKEENRKKDELRDKKARAFDHVDHVTMTDLRYIYKKLKEKGRLNDIKEMKNDVRNIYTSKISECETIEQLNTLMEAFDAYVIAAKFLVDNY